MENFSKIDTVNINGFEFFKTVDERFKDKNFLAENGYEYFHDSARWTPPNQGNGRWFGKIGSSMKYLHNYYPKQLSLIGRIISWIDEDSSALKGVIGGESSTHYLVFRSYGIVPKYLFLEKEKAQSISTENHPSFLALETYLLNQEIVIPPLYLGETGLIKSISFLSSTEIDYGVITKKGLKGFVLCFSSYKEQNFTIISERHPYPAYFTQEYL